MSKLIDLLLEDSKYSCDNIDFSFLNNKKILITGASGLVGVHLLSSLLYLKQNCNYKFHVIGIVNNEPEQWFKELIDLGDFSYIKGDLSDINFIQRLMDFDVIIHAATYGQPIRFMQNQIKTIMLNTSSTIELIKKLKPNGKFLFLSSSEIYSGLKKDFYSETDIGTTNPSHPRACYIESKRCGETICNSFNDNNIKIVRLCLAYGTGIRKSDTRAMNSFILNGLKDGEINLMDDGSAKRNYIYISNAINMMWNILLHGKETVYNVGGKSEVSIRELAEMINHQLGVPLCLGSKSGLVGSPDSVNLDLSKYESEFGVKDNISLDSGIRKVINWCRLIN